MVFSSPVESGPEYGDNDSTMGKGWHSNHPHTGKKQSSDAAGIAAVDISRPRMQNSFFAPNPKP